MSEEQGPRTLSEGVHGNSSSTDTWKQKGLKQLRTRLGTVGELHGTSKLKQLRTRPGTVGGIHGILRIDKRSSFELKNLLEVKGKVCLRFLLNAKKKSKHKCLIRKDFSKNISGTPFTNRC